MMKHVVVPNVFFVLIVASSSVSDSSREFCLLEVFQPSCPTSEAVIITQARFGRMKLGKCIEKEQGFESLLTNPQYLGCYVDVTKDLNDRCIGKRSCVVKVSDLSMEKKAPCSKNLMMYLEVEFRCLSVVQENRQCLVSLASNNVQYLMTKHKSEDRFCGTQKQPWIVETLKGQTIKVSRLRQTLDEDMSMVNEKSSRICSVENGKGGYVYDSEARNKVAICEENFYYTSKSNQIEITLMPTHDEMLLIKLEATGCSDLIPPADAWLKRTENEATIGCYSTRLRWQLKCDGQRWIGVIGNCSYVADNQPESQVIDRNFLSTSENYDYNQAFTITMVCAVGIILCSVIVCIGIVCIKRFTNESKLAESLLKEKQQTLSKGSFPNMESNGNIPNGRMYNELGEKHSLEENPDLHYFVLDKDEINKCSDPLV